MPGNITIQKILAILLHRIVFIIAAAAVMGLLFFLYSSIIVKPMYSTSAMIFVQNYDKAKTSNQDSTKPTDAQNGANNNSSNNAQAKKIFSSDISGSNSLAGICVTLFQNSDEITALYDGCSVTMEVNENTANQISEKCIEVYSKHFDYGQIGIIRTAKEPGSPISPDKVRSALIGAAIGLILACVISILLELVDTTIKPDEDLSEIYKVPVFAEIPDFDN